MPLQIVILDDILSFLFSISPFTCFFLLFAPLRDLPDTKKPWKSWYCHQKSRFPQFQKNSLSSSLLAPFWTTLDTILAAFALLGAPFGASWVPQALQKSKKERKTEVQNRPGRSEGPKERQRRPRTSKMDPKGLKNRPQMKKKSDVEELTLQKNIGWIDRLRAITLHNKHANFTKEIKCFS